MDLARDPEEASRLCREGHVRLLSTTKNLTPEEFALPSLLPDWTVGHVLTHLARNADAHSRRLAGTLSGRDVPKYQNGEVQRADEIEAGAFRPADQIADDLEASIARLEDVFLRCSAAGWPNGHFLGGGEYAATECPAHRLREVEMHHSDLGRGYSPLDWPEEYVAWELPGLLATVPDRLTARGRRQLMAWLAGRGPLVASTTLSPW